MHLTILARVERSQVLRYAAAKRRGRPVLRGLRSAGQYMPTPTRVYEAGSLYAICVPIAESGVQLTCTTRF